MNLQYILQNGEGRKYRCVLSSETNQTDQWERIFDIKKGYGFSVDLWKDRVDIVDYFHGETRATFRILSVEETEEATEALKILD